MRTHPPRFARFELGSPRLTPWPLLRRYYVDTATFTMYGDGLLSDDEGRAVFLYSCEWAPREDSLYYLVNEVLRDKHRSKARPFLAYIKLLCTALRKVRCCRRMPPRKSEGGCSAFRGIRADDSACACS